jgi:ABC-type polar amino acid transport system ATPase subunit
MVVLEKVTKRYQKVHAVKDVNLVFDKNETTAIIGPSGSGKSTLLRMINGLDAPTTGQVLINGKKLTQKNKIQLCLKVGMVFQAFNLFSHLNVQDNLIYAPINVLRMDRAQAIDKAERLLEQFGLGQKNTSFPVNLSGGQKQRVAICRALMMDPEVMLFDEPTSALDSENIKDIVEIISLLKKSMTMIVVTHHIKFARVISDRIVFMDHGVVLADQPKDQFFENPKSHRARLFLENIGDLM